MSTEPDEQFELHTRTKLTQDAAGTLLRLWLWGVGTSASGSKLKPSECVLGRTENATSKYATGRLLMTKGPSVASS